MTSPYVAFDNMMSVRLLGGEATITVLKHDFDERIVALACEDELGEHVMLTGLSVEQLRSIGEFLIERAIHFDRAEASGIALGGDDPEAPHSSAARTALDDARRAVR